MIQAFFGFGMNGSRIELWGVNIKAALGGGLYFREDGERRGSINHE